jgi:hypothetical protein
MSDDSASSINNAIMRSMRDVDCYDSNDRPREVLISFIRYPVEVHAANNLAKTPQRTDALLNINLESAKTEKHPRRKLNIFEVSCILADWG